MRLAACFLVLACTSVASAQTNATPQTQGGTDAGGGGGAPQAAESNLDTSDIDVSVPGAREQVETLFGSSEAGLFEAVTSNSGGRGSTRTFNSGNSNQSTNRSTTTSRSRQIRTRFRLSFVPSQALSIANVGTRLKKRLSRVAPRAETMSGTKLRGATASVKAGAKGVITLRGTVGSQNAKRLAAALMRLEPGVRKVDNQLQVASAATTRGPNNTSTDRSSSPTQPLAPPPPVPSIRLNR